MNSVFKVKWATKCPPPTMPIAIDATTPGGVGDMKYAIASGVWPRDLFRGDLTDLWSLPEARAR